MPVQVPKINRFAQQATQSVGRLDLPNIDTNRASEIQGAAANKLVATAASVYDNYVDASAEKKADELSTNYYSQLRSKFEGENGIKYKDGDPTQPYSDFQKFRKKTYDSLLANDISNLTKSKLKAKLDDIDQKYNFTVESWFGKTKDEYFTKVAEDRVRMLKTESVTATNMIDPKDPSSISFFDQRIKEIEDERIKDGLREGFVTQDEKGNYKYAEHIQRQMARDASEASVSAIKTLLNAGEIGKAEVIWNQYRNRIDAVQRPEIEKAFKTEKTDQDALTKFNEMRAMDPEDVEDFLDDIEDPEVADKASRLINNYRSRMDNLEKKKQKSSYNNIVNFILDKQKTDSPFTSSVEAEMDPYIKSHLPNVDGKQRLAIQQLIDKPKKTPPDVKLKGYEAIASGEIESMSPTDFAGLVAGMDQGDRSRFERIWTSAQNQTQGEKNQSRKYMMTEVEKEMQTLGLVVKDDRGRYSNAQQIVLNKAYDDLDNYIDKLPANMSWQDKNKWVKEFVAKKLVENKEPTMPVKTTGLRNPAPTKSAAATPPAPTGALKTISQMSASERQAKREEFKKAKGYYPNLSETTGRQEFMNFIGGK